MIRKLGREIGYILTYTTVETVGTQNILQIENTSYFGPT